MPLQKPTASASMMKTADPIVFGHAVTVYYKMAFVKHAGVFKKLGVNPNHGLCDLYAKIQLLPEGLRAAPSRRRPETSSRIFLSF